MRASYQVLLPLLSLFLNRELFTGIYPLKLRVQTIKVLDGDTIELLVLGRTERLRLSGIDAPEMGQPTRLGRKNAGELSKCCLIELMKNKDWELEWQGRDMYGRVLGEMWSSREALGLLMIQHGCASVYSFTRGMGERIKNERLEALGLAKKKRVGLWAYGGFMRPYHWRKTQKTKRTPVAKE